MFVIPECHLWKSSLMCWLIPSAGPMSRQDVGMFFRLIGASMGNSGMPYWFPGRSPHDFRMSLCFRMAAAWIPWMLACLIGRFTGESWRCICIMGRCERKNRTSPCFFRRSSKEYRTPAFFFSRSPLENGRSQFFFCSSTAENRRSPCFFGRSAEFHALSPGDLEWSADASGVVSMVAGFCPDAVVSLTGAPDVSSAVIGLRSGAIGLFPADFKSFTMVNGRKSVESDPVSPERTSKAPESISISVEHTSKSHESARNAIENVPFSVENESISHENTLYATWVHGIVRIKT